MHFYLSFLLSLGALSTIVFADKPAVAIVVEEDNIPQNFDYIGTYLVKSIIRVSRGNTTSSPITDTRYRIYSNGKEIRVYQSDVTESYHTYEIYRADGISEEDTHGNIAIKPGIQARKTQAVMTKQLSVTASRLTMTQFPPISDSIIITYAKRLEVNESNP